MYAVRHTVVFVSSSPRVSPSSDHRIAFEIFKTPNPSDSGSQTEGTQPPPRESPNPQCPPAPKHPALKSRAALGEAEPYLFQILGLPMP